MHVRKCMSACHSTWAYVCLCWTRLLPCLYTPPHTSPKSRGSNSLLWLTQIDQINNTINPPFRPLTPYSYGLDYHISSSYRSGSHATTNHPGIRGDCASEAACLKTISLSHSQLCNASFNILPSVFFCYQTKENNRDREHSFNQIILSLHHNYATLLSLLSQPTSCSIFTAFTTV